MENKEIKKIVREGYAEVAKKGFCCCSPSPVNSCCGPIDPEAISKQMGYTEEQIKGIPEEANLGLGCGNPVALASLKEGETVLDLGSGVGIDCFLAAAKVGKTGKVIGVDMTPEMIERGKRNAENSDYQNVDFRLGEIEELPVADDSIDVIISNCVINLSPDKKKVFEEAFRVLKPGGKLMVSDITLLKPLPKALMDSVDAYVGCISGAIEKDLYLDLITDAGFSEVKVLDQTIFPADIAALMVSDEDKKKLIDDLNMTIEEIEEIGNSIVSIKVEGRKMS
ncbi:arsenite methyltransferase [Methanococcoides methylutens]|uniref:arsenite methyltransferase n=1 Tax=Methanococcoides methylutens TaxID=2226 RepID=UPI00404459FB